MSDDLVKRLRNGLCMLAQEEAADRIEELEAKLVRYNEVVGDKINLRAENTYLKAKLAKAVECIKDWQSTGCPYCHGDCSSANPPVSDCIIQRTYHTLAKLTGGKDA